MNLDFIMILSALAIGLIGVLLVNKLQEKFIKITNDRFNSNPNDVLVILSYAFSLLCSIVGLTIFFVIGFMFLVK